MNNDQMMKPPALGPLVLSEDELATQNAAIATGGLGPLVVAAHAVGAAVGDAVADPPRRRRRPRPKPPAGVAPDEGAESEGELSPSGDEDTEDGDEADPAQDDTTTDED